MSQSRPVALVTGASRGIGRAIAVELAHTHHVIATYRGHHDAAGSLHVATGAEIIQSDIASADDRAALVEIFRQRKLTPDLVVNNAGMAPRDRRDVLEADEDSFDELMAVNLKGPHFLTRAIAPLMLDAGRGRIVFITSISAYTVSTNRAEYCISKAGLSMSAAVWAARLAPHGIQVFEIRPGVIRTDMIAAVEKAYEDRITAGLVPQRRIGEPTDIARAVRAIADGLLDYAAGQILDLDGGFHLRSI